MRDAAAELAAALESALASFAEAVTGAAPGWLVLGVILHLANQVARGRGWCTLVRCASAEPLRRRDAVLAWVAGAGAGGIASARGGDAVRVLLLRRRLPEAGCPLLLGTLVAEGAGELAVGAALIALALALGFAPSPGVPELVWIAPAVLGVLLVAVAVARIPRLLPRRLRAARDARGRAARGRRPDRRPAAPVRARLGRRRRSHARRRVRA